ncbi:MAG TPA: DoxX family protein [Paenirhodobacter sp.]
MTADKITVCAALRAVVTGLGRVGGMAAPPVLRIALALPFLRSGMTRWDGVLSLNPATPYLFETTFQLHLFGHAYPLPFPDLLAWITALAEIGLPCLLILGLATRLGALGLLLMTGVIQLIFPEAWVNFHLYWAAIALAIVALGPGKMSIDALIVQILRAKDLRL